MAPTDLNSLLTNKGPLFTESGFTIVEIIIALAIFILVVPGIVSTMWYSDNSVLESQQKDKALDLANFTLTSLEQNPFRDIHNDTHNEDIYQTTITTLWLDLYTKQVEVTVSWTTPSGKQQEVSLDSFLTDPAAARIGNTCLIQVPNSGPMDILSRLDFGIGNEVTGVVVRNHLAFVTTNSSTASIEDFFIADVTNGSSPIILAKLNTGPGLSSITLASERVFVGNTSINGQLQIIDISNKSGPVLKKTFKLPGVYTDNTTIANTLTYADSKIFLGTQKSQIAEFHVIAVSDVNSPHELSSLEIDTAVNNIAVVDTQAYIANPSSEEIKIVNLTDPTQPTLAGKFDAPGGSGNGKSLSGFGNTLVLGRTVGGQELYELDTAKPQSPQELSHRDLNTSINTALAVPGWQFLGTTDSTKSVQVWNTQNLLDPKPLKSLSLPSRVTAMACGLDNLYVASDTSLFIVAP